MIRNGMAGEKPTRDASGKRWEEGMFTNESDHPEGRKP
jgi:hypothetical protein